MLLGHLCLVMFSYPMHQLMLAHAESHLLHREGRANDRVMMADRGRSLAGIWVTLLDSLTAKAICMASGLRIERHVARTKGGSEGR